MYTLFYLKIYEFAGNLEQMIDEGTCKTSLKNLHKLHWKAQYFKSADTSILGNSCAVSQYPQFYDKIKDKHHILPRPYV